MALVAAVATTAATTAGLAYLDAKFHFRKDITLIRAQARIAQEWQKAVKANRTSLYYFIENVAAAKADGEAIWSRQGCYTWSQLYTRANQYAQWFLQKGVKPGDLVAFMMANSPDFVLAWIGLWAIGAAPAMINYNLVGPALLHCVDVSAAKFVLVDGGPEVLARAHEVRGQLESKGVEVVYLASVKDDVCRLEARRPGDELRANIKGTDPYGLFYTSGTTGMPKACTLPVMVGYSMGIGQLGGLSVISPDKDRFYGCMPYYHGTGGINAAAQLMAGVTLCIAPKFSVSGFWDDIRDSRATWFVYVGETLRYLLAAPPSPRDKEHNVHSIFGNGLRPDVWKAFRDRFGIRRIHEFFNSTEGMFGLSNVCQGDFTAYAVGHHGLINRWRNHNLVIPVAIDTETGDIQRDPKTGFARRVPYEQGGEILIAISPQKMFPGYFNNPEATEKKLIRNVFKNGDCYYRTGDALRRDPDGRWFFLDRLGDTFRWKGENVSTAEVSETLGRYPGVTEAVVYGVDLPGHDGKAGVAAIYTDSGPGSFDHSDFLRHARSQLPRFAVPIFLRHLSKTRLTHNNKQDKEPLKREGVHPEKVQGPDEIFWIDGHGKGATYVRFTPQDWHGLSIGKAKL